MSVPTTTGMTSWVGRLRRDLRANTRRTRILLALLPVLVVAWIPVFAGGGDTKPPVQAVGESPAALVLEPGILEPTAPVDLLLRAELGALVGELDQVWEPTWQHREGEEPFSRPAATVPDPGQTSPDLVRRAVQRSAEALREEQAREEERRARLLMPTSTILSPTREDLVVIGGQMLRCGEQIAGFEVRRISSRTVVLGGRLGEYELRIPRGDEEEP